MCVVSDQRKHNHNLYTLDLVHDSSGRLFPDFVFWFLEYVGDGANRFVGNLDAETLKNFCDFN